MTEEKCNLSYDNDLFIFGGHYTADECREIIKAENYDEPSNYSDSIRHTYVKHGLVWCEGERSSGWTEQSEMKKGRIKATVIEQQ